MKQIKLTKAQIEKIQFLPFNRAYKVRPDLVAKMNKYGFVVPIILIKTDLITGKEEIYVVDGQHRLVTSQFLGIEPYAELQEIVFKTIPEIVDFVASLNSTHKAWDLKDYISAYAYLGYDEYITLNKIADSCPFTINTVASMLYGYRSKGSVASNIREGKFVCKQLEETKKTIKYAARLSKFGKLTSRMILALHYVYNTKNFNEDLFEARYKKEYECVKELKLDDYTDVFSSWV